MPFGLLSTSSVNVRNPESAFLKEKKKRVETCTSTYLFDHTRIKNHFKYIHSTNDHTNTSQ
jgi:hypothetical protein